MSWFKRRNDGSALRRAQQAYDNMTPPDYSYECPHCDATLVDGECPNQLATIRHDDEPDEWPEPEVECYWEEEVDEGPDPDAQRDEEIDRRHAGY